MSGKKKIIGLFIAGILVGIFILPNPFRNTDKAIEIKSGTIKKGTVVETLSTTGVLIPIESQLLVGQDIVTDVKVKVGDKVKKDDILATYLTGFSLKANIDGTVTALNIKEDEPDLNAQAGQPSIAVEDLSNLQVQLSLSKSEAAIVKMDQKSTIINGKETFNGKVTELDPVAQTRQTATGGSTSLRAIVSFDEAPTTLFSGFEADVDIITATGEDVLILPIEALKYDKNNKPFAFLIKDGKAKKRVIKTGLQSDILVEIKKGLVENDKVILSPSSDIKNDCSVVIK